MISQIVMMSMLGRIVNMATKTMFLQTPTKVNWVNKNLPEAGRVFAALGSIQRGSFVDTLRVTKGPVEAVIQPADETVATRVFVYYRGKLRETTALLSRPPLSVVTGDLYKITPARGQRVWLTSYDKLWGGSWSKVEVFINSEDLIAPLVEASAAAKAVRPRFGGRGGRRAGMEMIDTETGAVYHSKTEIGKRFASAAGADPKSKFAWYVVQKKFPGRFIAATEEDVREARAKGVYYQI